MAEDTNGNGQGPILDIDVTNDVAYKTAVVQHLQVLSDRTMCLVDLKRKVERHERIVVFGKWLSVPLFALIHAGIKTGLKKIGIDF